MALYAYTSGEPGDLSFNQGEVMQVVKKDGDWWTGIVGDRSGIFPANYVKKMETQVDILSLTIKQDFMFKMSVWQSHVGEYLSFVLVVTPCLQLTSPHRHHPWAQLMVHLPHRHHSCGQLMVHLPIDTIRGHN